jgi:16S rRNA (cytosine967-C5)-methyltransferase
VSDSSSLPLSELILATARNVQAVMAGQSLTESLAQTPADRRAAAQALASHSMRQLGLAQAIRSHMVSRTPSDALFDAILLVSISLLETAMASQAAVAGERTVPAHWPVYDAHTVVNQAVNAVGSQRRLQPFKALLNGVLRRYGRERDKIRSAVLTDPQARWNYPNWWIRRLRKAYPDAWQAVLEAANVPAPMMLRVNKRKISPGAFLETLKGVGLAGRCIDDAAVLLETPRPVEQVPGFKEGFFSVQDAAAQQAALLLDAQPGMRVLDACAAPGGKTAHILERADVSLCALDVDEKRLARVGENLSRLSLMSDKVSLQCANAASLNAWWDGLHFDCVLADVPCTASGVVRRHPDIRWLRREADIARTVALQASILDALWTTVKPGGKMLYVTCSVFPQEGELQAKHFQTTHSNAELLPSPGQILPAGYDGTKGLHDGFFFALFAKRV